MSKWKEVRLGEVIMLKRGYDLPLSKFELGKYPVIAASDLRGYHSDFKASPPVITLGRSGSIGDVQIVFTEAWPLNTTLYVKKFNGNNEIFIYYLLKTIDFKRFNSGAGVPTLNRNHLNKLKIKIPDLETQKKVAQVLSSYDELIENNNRRIELLENMAEEIYKEWFVRMRFPGHEEVSFEKGIPEGWEVKKIGELGEVITGKTPSTKNNLYYGNDILFVKTPDMHNNTFINDTEVKLSSLGSKSQINKLLPENSIMVSCIGTGGIVSINSKKAHTNQQINSIILKDIKLREWAYLTLKSMKGTIEAFGSTGATMTNLSKGKFENLKILYPTKKLLLEFNLLNEPIFSKILKLNKQNQNLIKQRDMLLPRLMNGTIEVK